MTARHHTSPWHGLRLMRESKGWSQADLAEKSGLSQSHISRLENGSRWPTRTIVPLLAAALGLPIAMMERRIEEVA